MYSFVFRVHEFLLEVLEELGIDNCIEGLGKMFRFMNQASVTTRKMILARDKGFKFKNCVEG